MQCESSYMYGAIYNGQNFSCSPPPDSTQLTMSTMVICIVILVGEWTALWASQQHANLPAVVWRTAVYPAKLMCGGKRYSFACV